MKALAILMLALALGGCSIFTPRPVPVPLTLPPMPHEIASPCRDPGVRAGQLGLGEFARNRLALAECSRKHRAAVSFYNRFREVR